MEIANLIFNILMGLGTIGLAIIAFFALYTWRKEFIGKRKIELAAEIMMAVLNFQSVLIEARLNRHTPQETNDIKKWLEKVNLKKQNVPGGMLWPIYPEKIFCLAPIHRLNKNSETTDNFFALADKSLIYWDENLYKLLFELYSFLGKIRYASEMLYENINDAELQKTAFADTTKDPISTRIFEIGEEIKLNLEPIYKDRQTKWKKLAETRKINAEN